MIDFELFKIVNLEEAKLIPMKLISMECINIFEVESSSFGIVKGDKEKNFTTLKGFVKAIEKLEDNDIYSVDFGDYNYYSITNSFFGNKELKPKYSKFSFIMYLSSSELYNLSSIIEFIKILKNKYDFEFDYGFSETKENTLYQKIIKYLFGTISSPPSKYSTKDQFIWNFNKYAVKNGFIKDIFKINFLNSKHLEIPEIKNLTNNYGILSMCSPNLYCWSLNDKELKIVKKEIYKTKYSMINPLNPSQFLKLQESKEYFDLMNNMRKEYLDKLWNFEEMYK